jgi:hypothetical protein
VAYQILSTDISFALTDIAVDKPYILYYFGSTDEPDVLSTYTPIYKVEFMSRGTINLVQAALIVLVNKFVIIGLGCILVWF